MLTALGDSLCGHVAHNDLLTTCNVHSVWMMFLLQESKAGTLPYCFGKFWDLGMDENQVAVPEKHVANSVANP